MTDLTYRKTIAIGAIGNILEWYDFSIFAYFSTIIGRLIFPDDDMAASSIKTFLIFAIGFLARPLGGIIFGYMGDRIGRKYAMQMSIIITGISTAFMGLMPTYMEIGLLAPIFFLVVRIIQGVAAGGELVSSTAYLYESAPGNRQYFTCSWVTCSSMAGVLSGSLVTSILYYILPADSLEKWGWRLAFEFGLISVVFGIWLRKNMGESEQFEKMKLENSKKTVIDLPIKKYIINIIQVGLINMFVSINFYLLFIWMPSYLQVFLLKPANSVLLINSIALFFLIAFTPLSGMIADRIGEKTSILFSVVSICLLTYPLFLLLRLNLWLVLIAQITFAFCLSSIEGVLSASMAKRFPVNLRLRGLGIAYNVSTSLFGGTAPLICGFLIQKTALLAIPAIYIVVAALVTLPFLLFGNRYNYFIPNNDVS